MNGSDPPSLGLVEALAEVPFGLLDRPPHDRLDVMGFDITDASVT